MYIYIYVYIDIYIDTLDKCSHSLSAVILSTMKVIETFWNVASLVLIIGCLRVVKLRGRLWQYEIWWEHKPFLDSKFQVITYLTWAKGHLLWIFGRQITLKQCTVILTCLSPSATTTGFFDPPSLIIPAAQRSCWFHSIHPSVCPSVRLSIRPSRIPCPLCSA